MTIKLTNAEDHAIEGGAFGIIAAFTDEKGAALVPSTITWTLTDIKGNVINSRNDIAVAIPASSVTTVLSGADLGITAAEKAAATETFVLRVFTMEGTFTSDLGTGLPLREQLTFAVDITVVDHDGN